MITPCERVIWYLLPAIRKEIIKSIIKNHKLTQRQTAKLLGLSDAAVSQYLSNKRGKLEIKDASIREDINRTATRIVRQEGKTSMEELCKLCNLIRTKTNIMDSIDYKRARR